MLGGAVALALALELPPAGLILQSTFTTCAISRACTTHSCRTGWCPTRTRASIDRPAAQGNRDEIVPLSHGERLFAAAPEPTRLHVVAGAGHNDLVTRMGASYGAVIARLAGSSP